MQPTLLYLQTILQNSVCFLHYFHISCVPLVLHWWTLLQTLLSNSVCYSHCTLHTARISSPKPCLLFKPLTLLLCNVAFHNIDWSSSRARDKDAIVDQRERFVGKGSTELGIFQGGMSSTFCSSHISKAEFIFSASPKTQLLSAASSCNFPSSQSNALRGKAFPGKVLFSQKNVLFTGLSGSGWVKSMALKVWSKEILKREIL